MLRFVLQLFRRDGNTHSELLTLDQRLDDLTKRLDREKVPYEERLRDRKKPHNGAAKA